MTDTILYLIGGIVAIVVIFIIMSNSLNSKKINVERAWSNIDTYLQQRLDELEALYSQILTIIDEESSMFKEVARLRSMIGTAKNTNEPNDVLSAYNEGGAFMRGFHIENYPELKSIEQAMYTAQRTSAIETNINAARRVYNNNVASYNLAISNFPTSLVAGMLGHQKVLMFKADERAQSRPKLASEDFINKKYQDKIKKDQQ